jgi:hypothetical protein
MKKIFFIALALTAFLSCKNETKSKDVKSIENKITVEQSEALILLRGDFVYFDGAAVLQTPHEIYGVLVTKKMEELNLKAETYKNEPTDMVQVAIKGKVTNKKNDKILWENKVEIVEILSVEAALKEENNVVKLGKE